MQHIDDIENKRSRLFPDRRRIPGRKTKYMVAISFALHFYFVMKLAQRKAVIQRKGEEQVQLQRKVAPLFQAVGDQEYTIIKHRWDLLAKEVMGEEFVRRSYFHNRDITWVPANKDWWSWTRSGMERYRGSIGTHFGNRYMNGFETQNI